MTSAIHGLSDDYPEVVEKMEKSISFLESNLSSIRAGRATPAVLNKLNIEYYGVSTPINQVCSMSVPEARVLVIQPWDASILKEIEKAIQKSDIGINPNNDGKVIRLVFPPLTEERRGELIKHIRKYGEETRIAIRALRREYIEVSKTQKKKGEITEDDLETIEKDIQHITDDFISKVDKILEDKEKELLEV